MPKSEPFDRDNTRTLKDERRKNWFWDSNEIFSSDLSAYAKLVRIYLARCANGDRQAFPSYNRIAKDCGISRDTAKRAVAELEEKGWIIKKIQIKNDGEHSSNIYSLCDPPQPMKEEIRPVVIKNERGRCSQHPPCHNLGGVVSDSTYVGADSIEVGAVTAPNNTNITKQSFMHTSIHHDKNKNHVHAKSEERRVVDNVDKKNDPVRLQKILRYTGFEGSNVEVEFIATWANVFPLDMIEYAVKKSVLNGKKNLPYIGGVFESWLVKGVRTIEQAESETRYDSVRGHRL